MSKHVKTSQNMSKDVTCRSGLRCNCNLWSSAKLRGFSSAFWDGRTSATLVPPMGQWSCLCLGMFPGGHPWHVILMKNLFGFRDFCRKLPWISRISTAREEKHRHHGESHDCTGPRPPRPVWNSVKPGFNQHFPHEFVWKITLKHVKTQI